MSGGDMDRGEGMRWRESRDASFAKPGGPYRAAIAKPEPPRRPARGAFRVVRDRDGTYHVERVRHWLWIPAWWYWAHVDYSTRGSESEARTCAELLIQVRDARNEVKWTEGEP